jgi:hypothetical protein
MCKSVGKNLGTAKLCNARVVKNSFGANPARGNADYIPERIWVSYITAMEDIIAAPAGGGPNQLHKAVINQSASSGRKPTEFENMYSKSRTSTDLLYSFYVS